MARGWQFHHLFAFILFTQLASAHTCAKMSVSPPPPPSLHHARVSLCLPVIAGRSLFFLNPQAILSSRTAACQDAQCDSKAFSTPACAFLKEGEDSGVQGFCATSCPLWVREWHLPSLFLMVHPPSSFSFWSDAQWRIWFSLCHVQSLHNFPLQNN